MNPTRLVVDQDVPDGRETIHNLLIDYNDRNAPPHNYKLLGILLKDEGGNTIGGLWGWSVYEWLFVELLFVPEELRGQGLGTSLLRQAEDIARERNCTGVWLDTFDFQALPFYQELGYTIFGELEDHPRGISQYWLQRRFDTEPRRSTLRRYNPRMRLLQPPRAGTVVKVGVAAGAVAVGAAALGAVAFGAVAIGALAVGKFAVGKLKLKLGHMEKLHVGELTVDNLIVRNRTDA